MDAGYDLIEDFGLITASFRAQYGIRLSKEAGEMPWHEFCDLLSGLSPETPLGRMIRIRTETDEEILKLYTPEQNKIRSEWQAKVAKDRSEKETDSFLESMQEIFKKMAGG